MELKEDTRLSFLQENGIKPNQNTVRIEQKHNIRSITQQAPIDHCEQESRDSRWGTIHSPSGYLRDPGPLPI